ncbi:MAG TPA: (deoxy)nucleoside triphosphate pyrophosphohydrolase [Jatrophihabitans sp.]|nr:(deoxy)nucleoside triphosphate pyrophosphohydrolase [Jatrophihabitans sp.]
MTRSHHTRDDGAMEVQVVGAAIVRAGRVLAARRSPANRHGGGWEFPGGKVEPGESDEDALVRECREELGATVTVDQRLGHVTDGGIALTLYAAQLMAGEPVALVDHDELRWLAPADLDSVDWLPIDRDLLPAVRALLMRAT